MDNGDLRMVMQIRVFLAGSGTDQNSPDPTKKVWIQNRTKKTGFGSCACLLTRMLARF